MSERERKQRTTHLPARARLAILGAKCSASAIRLTGRGGGTALPGKVALMLDPELPGRLVGQLPAGAMVVTGTNGKTTTSRMLSRLLTDVGLQVVANRAGANMKTGIAATLVQSGNLGGRLGQDVAVLEVDERSLPGVVAQIPPRALLVTNLFRDQLDRAGEPAIILSLMREVLAKLRAEQVVVLNADDPTVADLGRDLAARVVYYGLEVEPVQNGSDAGYETPDADMCLNCGVRFEYSCLYYAHLGHYRCPKCGRRRPKPDFRVTRLESTGKGHRLRIEADGQLAGDRVADGQIIEVELEMPGLYNAYNALAAVAVCLATGRRVPVRLALGNESQVFGRMEQVAVGDRTLLLALVKNPTGAQESIEAIMPRPGFGHLVFALNDNDADGRDVSWVWDIHLERLAGRHDLRRVTVTGTRAADMAVRFKYAGFDENKLHIVPSLERAIDEALAAAGPNGELAFLVTYTALLQARQILERRGLVRPFWEA